MSLRAALVHSLILEIYIICLFIILVVGPLLAQDVLRITLKTLAVMLAAAIAHWCLNRGLLRLAGIFLITFAWLKVAESIFNSWGPLSPQLVLMPVLVAMAAFILGTRAALIFAFASLLFGAAMVIFQPNEAAMARPWPPPPHVVVVALAIGLACLIWPLSVMFGTLRATLSQLKVSETRFRSLATGAHVVSAVIDANGVFLLSEGLALARLGLKPGEVVGRSVFDAYSDYPEILDIIRAGLRGESHRTEIALMDAWFDSLFLPQFDARGHITELFIVSTDITERKRAEAEREKLAGRLRQGQVLESVGRLAGGVAHDLNNMLTPILGFAEMLREEFPAGDPRAAQLGHIHSAAKRARQITTQLLAFARRQPTDMRIHDLNTILGDFDPMLRRAVREDIRLVSHLHRAPLFILCDVLEIERILLNLVLNSQDALPEGGVVSITTASRSLPEGPRALLAVHDGGAGFSPEDLQRAFEPFYTTKPIGAGTGLGLSTVYGIVRQHGGSIDIRSVRGSGATVEILFPCAPAPAGDKTSVPAPPPLQRGSECILVAEDETQVRQIVCDTLARAGYRVMSAPGGLSALELLRSAAEPPSLLLTDVVMPQFGGIALARQARQSHPALRVLFISGYIDAGAMPPPELGAFLPKPFSPGELTAAVRAALDA